jgi:hypothetical protein
MKEPTEEVFVVVQREKGTDNPWELYTTWGSRTGRPYVKAGPAKGIASGLNSRDRGYCTKYEYAVKRGVVQWDEDTDVIR